MKLKERFTLLRAGYTKADIEAMIAAEAEEAEDQTEESEEPAAENEDLTKANNRIKELEKQLEELQKHNINNSSQKEPTKETSDDVWSSFFGTNRKDDNK